MDLDIRSGSDEVLVPARPECVTVARTAVRGSAWAAGLSADAIDDLLVAVSEACTNAIEAQLEAGVPEPIVVRCARTTPELVVEVQDRAGGGFDPQCLVARPTQLDAERGWGVQLMGELVDRLELVPVADGTIARLTVSRPG